MPAHIIRIIKDSVQIAKTPRFYGCVVFSIVLASVNLEGSFEVSPVVMTAATVGPRQLNFGSYSEEELYQRKSETETESSEQPNDRDLPTVRDSQTDESEGKRVVIYARVSSQEQVEDTNSIERQLHNLHEIVEEEGFNLVHEPFTDPGVSGTEIDREGLKSLHRFLQTNDVDYVMVESLTRLSRIQWFGLMLIMERFPDLDTQVYTCDGPLDSTSVNGFVTTGIETLFTQYDNLSRTKHSVDGSKTSFRMKNYTAAYNYPPFGYEKSSDWDDDEEPNWLEVDEELRDVVKDIFTYFVESASISAAYAETKRFAEAAHGVTLPKNLKNRMLVRTAYIGCPSATYENDVVEVEDEDLRIISDELFEKAQSKIADIKQRNSSNNPDGEGRVVGLTEYLREIGVDIALDIVDYIGVLCPDESCQTPMRRNGQRKLKGGYAGGYDRVRQYVCPDCGRQQSFPRAKHFLDAAIAKSDK